MKMEYRLQLPSAEMAEEPWPMAHFPARFQAVIFRNWNRAPAECLARVLATAEADVHAAARELGLREYDPARCRLWRERGYLTVIRQNWHLLDYAQLLDLLEWPEEKLYRVLMEEDFFWHKLGDRKPFCPKVAWRELTPAERSATARLRALLAPLIAEQGAKEFDFLAAYEEASPVAAMPPKPGEPLRLIYSYCAPFGDVLLPGAPDPFPPGLLAQYRASGVNAVWLPVLLSDLTPWTGDDDYSQGWERRQAGLRRLTARLGEFGIGLFLYLNEPRALPEAIAARHPGWAGTPNPDGSGTRAVCIGNPEVSGALRSGVAALCRAVPELGGILSITMSENLTHCLSKTAVTDCPRCRNLENPAANVIAVLSAICDGMRDAQSHARLIAWSWAWSPEWDTQILDALPRDIELMCVSETGLETDCRGVRGRILDYSLAHPGPGPVASRLWQYARNQGRRIVAKLQLNATWELSSLPYVPVPQLAKRHLEHLAELGIGDFMLSWTLGGAPGGNLPLVDCTVREWCERRFGRHHAAAIEAACRKFSQGFGQFPFDGTSLIYTGPQNFGCANLLYSRPTGCRATMVGFCYDDLASWSGGGHYPPELLETVFMAMAADWNDGLDILRGLSAELTDNPACRELAAMAEAGYCMLQSSANQIAFCRRRDTNDRIGCAKLAEAEGGLARRLLAVQRCDSRIGFEASNHYLYHENELLEKILQCDKLTDLFKRQLQC